MFEIKFKEEFNKDHIRRVGDFKVEKIIKTIRKILIKIKKALIRTKLNRRTN